MNEKRSVSSQFSYGSMQYFSSAVEGCSSFQTWPFVHHNSRHNFFRKRCTLLSFRIPRFAHFNGARNISYIRKVSAPYLVTGHRVHCIELGLRHFLNFSTTDILAILQHKLCICIMLLCFSYRIHI